MTIMDWITAVKHDLGGKLVSLIIKPTRQSNLSEKSEEENDSKVMITFEDIEDEIYFWQSSIVGYVVGANPPLHVKALCVESGKLMCIM